MTDRERDGVLAGIRGVALATTALTIVAAIVLAVQIANGMPAKTSNIGSWGGTFFTAFGLACGFHLYWIYFSHGRQGAKYALLSVLTAALTAFIAFLVVQRIWGISA